VFINKRTAVVNKATAVFKKSTETFKKRTATFKKRTATFKRSTANFGKTTATFEKLTEKYNKPTASPEQACTHIEAHLQPPFSVRLYREKLQESPSTANSLIFCNIIVKNCKKTRTGVYFLLKLLEQTPTSY
jgi:hypothetical protein